jgi:hypothetical protein
MSLDVYLIPDLCPHCGRGDEGYEANITHNLGKMADMAGIYACVWRPDENGFEFASQIIEPLGAGIEDMRKRPAYFRQFDSPNGWGTYDQFLPWLERYLASCKRLPGASIRVSR